MKAAARRFKKKQKVKARSSTETNKTTSETKGEKDITFIVLPKNVRSLTQEVEGCRWDAPLISETWRSNKAEIWEIQ